MRPSSRFNPVILCTLALFSGGCVDRADAPQPNIIFISLDTFRPDLIGKSDSTDKPVTPNLSNFAESSVVFKSAFAQIPFTLPSHMSMFTGLYPDAHGIINQNKRLPTEVTTLPQELHGRGYTTMGFFTTDWLKEDFGFGLGFEHYERVFASQHTYAGQINKHILAALTKADLSRPLFLFAHYYDGHSDFHNKSNTLPYYSPERFRQDLAIPSTSDEFCDGSENCATAFLQQLENGAVSISATKLQTTVELYSRGIQYLDEQLGHLLYTLRSHDVYEDSIILVTSDHGEEFQEHGKFIHSQAYDESIAIPLIIRFPNGKYGGTVVDELAESIDFLPTILDYLEIPRSPTIQGQSLLPMITTGTANKHAVLSQDKLHHQRYSFRTADFKLIHDFASGRSELYNLNKDPGEQNDISDSAKAQTAALKSELQKQIRSNLQLAETIEANASSGTVLSEEEMDRLRAIGYLN